MAKLLSQRDWDFNKIGTIFELDEITPAYEMEHRADENGEIIKGQDGRPRNFATDKVIGHSYSVTILDGKFKKKSTSVKVLNPKPLMTNEDILKRDSVKVEFIGLECSMAGNPMYYKAESVILSEK